MGFWTYCISPIFAAIITVSTNTFLDNQISALENQLIAVSGRIDHMNKIWSVDIARGVMDVSQTIMNLIAISKAENKNQ